MQADITVITATIGSRDLLLQRAINSVKAQTLQPKHHLIKMDTHRQGGAAVIDQLLDEVTTKYVAVLDDDDEFFPNHLELCYNKIMETDADLVYPGFEYFSQRNMGHLEKHFGEPWSNDNIHQTTITTLAKTDVIREVGGYSKDWDPESFNVDGTGNRIGYDFLMVQRLAAAGKHIVHLAERTWCYHDDRASTLGMASRT